MKHTLIPLLVTAALSAVATPVRFALPDHSGTNVYRTTLTLTLTNAPAVLATNIFAQRQHVVTITNLPTVVELHPGPWRAQIGTVSWLLHVPDTNTVQDASALSTGLSAYTYTTPLPYYLAAGSNIVIVTVGATNIIHGTAVSGTPGGTADLGLLTTNALWVSAALGNDATAQRGRPDLPFLTCSNAQFAALPGDTIYVASGQYIEENLGLADVGWVLASDTIIGSSNSVGGVVGPVFRANGFDLLVRGGNVHAQSTALETLGGTIHLRETSVFPPPRTNTISGFFFTP